MLVTETSEKKERRGSGCCTGVIVCCEVYGSLVNTALLVNIAQVHGIVPNLSKVRASGDGVHRSKGQKFPISAFLDPDSPEMPGLIIKEHQAVIAMNAST